MHDDVAAAKNGDSEQNVEKYLFQVLAIRPVSKLDTGQIMQLSVIGG